ncbi:MAG: hypothetical protein ACR652_18570 [Methylocystis sp.]|uniref:hypothetical protein n=1 Tax=Methylocystis sp. TaxID=1911079 RepID=UPI003DA677A6
MAVPIQNRFLLFSNPYGDTLGGWYDFQSAHATHEEAIAAFFNKYGPNASKAWYQVVDVMALKISEEGSV